MQNNICIRWDLVHNMHMETTIKSKPFTYNGETYIAQKFNAGDEDYFITLESDPDTDSPFDSSLPDNIDEWIEWDETLIRFENFKPGPDGAYATCRLIPGADSAMDPQEWAEKGEINGSPAIVYYIFAEDEANSEDTENYPWDFDHVDRIIIPDED